MKLIIGKPNAKIPRLLLLVMAGVLSLLLTLSATPTWARSPVGSDFGQRAPVVLDGRVLFEVSGLNSLSARERADAINKKLRQVERMWLEREGSAPEFSIDRENQQTTLSVNQIYVLTVTPNDLREERTAVDRARNWGQQIVRALEIAKTERSAVYLRQAALNASVVLGGAIAAHFLLRWLSLLVSRQLAKWLEQNRSFSHRWDELLKQFVRLGRIGGQTGLWAAIAYYITDLFPQLRRWRYILFDIFRDSFTQPIFTLNQAEYSVLDLLFLLTVSVGLWLAVRALTRVLKTRILSVTNTDRKVQDVLALLTQYALTFIGLIVILQIWGLDVSSLTIVASVLGVGIGFGLQNIANNLISGLIITFERHIQVGDFVELASLTGIVERIGARSTQIVTLDQVKIIVPNSRFLESEVINWSHGSPTSRLHVPVGVSYSSDPNQVRSVLLDVAKGHPDVLVNPQPQVWLKNFGESSIDFDLLVWIREPQRQFPLRSELYYRIAESLQRHQIEIPFPQRDLHVRSTHLDEIVTNLKQLQQNGSATRGDRADDPVNQNSTQLISKTELHSQQATSTQLLVKDFDMEELICQMRGTDGVEIKDRWYRMNLYPASFVGAEAVDWLMRTQKYSQEDALQLGQLLCDRAIIHHVLDERPFIDGYHFYRFYADER